MDVEIEKSKLRKIFREKRSAISPAELSEKSQQINQNFINNLLPKIYHNHCGKIFSIYLPCGNEVSTTLISEHFKKNQIKFSYPKIIEKNQPLEFVLTDENQLFAPSNFFSKITEPLSGKKILPDFIILPLLAFDLDFSRLGMGGGFFDRTIEHLKKQKSEIVVIGLAFDFQRSRDTIPTTKTDQKLDFVVTEKTIFSAS